MLGCHTLPSSNMVPHLSRCGASCYTGPSFAVDLRSERVHHFCARGTKGGEWQNIPTVPYGAIPWMQLFFIIQVYRDTVGCCPRAKLASKYEHDTSEYPQHTPSISFLGSKIAHDDR